MLPKTIPAHTLTQQTRLTQQSIKEAGSLTTYLRTQASPEEKRAYLRATPPGSKAGTAPKSLAQLRAFMRQQ